MKIKLLRIVNIILFLTALIQLMSGFFPAVFGSVPVHQIGAWLLLACIITHVVLNWGWIKSNYLAKKKTKATKGRKK